MTFDAIPAFLRKGWFVVNRAAAAQNLPLLEDLNRTNTTDEERLPLSALLILREEAA